MIPSCFLDERRHSGTTSCANIFYYRSFGFGYKNVSIRVFVPEGEKYSIKTQKTELSFPVGNVTFIGSSLVIFHH